jgi:tetratricopeptide (TPR) repeat protein
MEKAAEHLVSCERCRTLAGTLLEELRAADSRFQVAPPLQLVVALIERERQWGVESLAAIAEWSELRRLPRRSQRERVRISKGCHTREFFSLVLGELKDEGVWEEAEFLASLALLCIEAMNRREQIAPASGHDLQAEVWTAVANSRRRAAEWKRAHQALANAERLLKTGMGEPRLKAALLSIAASTLADQGQMTEALDTLERCKAIYQGLSEWALLARTLVKEANVLEPHDPAKGLEAVDRALPMIPAEDSYLMLLATLLRTECLIGMGKPREALQVFRRCSHLLETNGKVRVEIRGKFICAKLLDALGHKPQAERLFHEVIDRDIEHDLYKDAFLDLLYLYGHHVKAGDLEKAAAVCRRALTDPSLSAVAHEEIRTLWGQLLEAARHQAISQDLLRELRRYVSVHWKHPAGSPPWVG